MMGILYFSATAKQHNELIQICFQSCLEPSVFTVDLEAKCVTATCGGLVTETIKGSFKNSLS